MALLYGLWPFESKVLILCAEDVEHNRSEVLDRKKTSLQMTMILFLTAVLIAYGQARIFMAHLEVVFLTLEQLSMVPFRPLPQL